MISEKTQTISIKGSEDSYHALWTTRKMAHHAGFSKSNQMLIATVVSELATNIIRYAFSGEIKISLIHKNKRAGIEIHAIDQGPGIKDVDKAMEDGYTTTASSAGLGLSSLKRIMDEYSINSRVNEGVSITARKWISDNVY